MSQEALLPVFAEACQECLDVILVNGKMPLEGSGERGLLLMAIQDGSRIYKENLGVGDDTGEHEGMGGAAAGAAYPAYAQAQEAVPNLNGRQISPMPD